MNTHPRTYLPTVTHNRRSQTHTEKQCGLVNGIKFSGHRDLAGVVNLYLTCEKISTWISGDSQGERKRETKEKVRALKRGGELQTNSISGRQESGRGMERNIQSNARKSVWESGRQSPAQEVKEIKENRQWVREKERNRRTERERQKQADREIHDPSLSL